MPIAGQHCTLARQPYVGNRDAEIISSDQIRLSQSSTAQRKSDGLTEYISTRIDEAVLAVVYELLDKLKGSVRANNLALKRCCVKKCGKKYLPNKHEGCKSWKIPYWDGFSDNWQISYIIKSS